MADLDDVLYLWSGGSVEDSRHIGIHVVVQIGRMNVSD